MEFKSKRTCYPGMCTWPNQRLDNSDCDISKAKRKVVPVHALEAYRGSGVITPVVNTALDGGAWSTSRPSRFSSRKEPGSHGVEGAWAGWKKTYIQSLPGFELRIFHFIAQSVCQIRQPGTCAYDNATYLKMDRGDLMLIMHRGDLMLIMQHSVKEEALQFKCL